ncbi:16077_t:CDS:1, partial [Entrophospora sp. SA101]
IKQNVENNNNDDENVIGELNKEVTEENIAPVEIKVQEIDEEIEVSVVSLTEDEEREEGIVVEWLLGTCLTYKSIRDPVDLVQDEGNNVESDSDDDVFVDPQEIDYIDDNVTNGNNSIKTGA